jgi:hypothetical protein
MATNGTPPNDALNRYLDAWADTMTNIWIDKLNKMDVNRTGRLMSSLTRQVYRDASGDVVKIQHTFLRYGIYVSRGTGKGYTPDRDFEPRRKPRNWYSGSYWYSKNKLLAEMIRQTGQLYLTSITQILSGQNSK